MQREVDVVAFLFVESSRSIVGAVTEGDSEILELWRSVQLVHLRVTHLLHRGLVEDAGIGYQDYVVLTELRAGPRRVTELAEGVGFEKSRLSHQLDRLEREGLVERRRALDDRRGAEVAITAPGRRLQARATPAHLERVRALFDRHLSPTERRALRTAAGKVLGALDGE